MRPALYKCEICDHPLDPKDSSVLRMITGWAKVNSVKFIEQNHFRYIHEFCKSRTEDPNQLGLF